MFEMYNNSPLTNSDHDSHPQINATHITSGPDYRWLESSCDGLLSLEAERFLLSLPFDYVPGNTALLRPELINRLALTWMKSSCPEELAQWIESVQTRPELNDEQVLPMVSTEMQTLKTWLRSDHEASHLFFQTI